ncbi:hypothetical protein SGRA_1983 [Saprospira grandis str. Lewin]|uniref:Uncharacterized protein n=1 Tax=Saprospira grandis (strain Lewin) TaxID=984262 RepID=H6L276_SAPGL|nr:hypothetical protein SGRA_1983 [Saprospira grandis str. Lewin]
MEEVFLFLRMLFWGLPPSAAGPLQGSQVCSALQPFGLRSGLRPPFQAPRPNGSSALRPSFGKNFRLVKAFFKGIAVAMAEKNNAE